MRVVACLMSIVTREVLLPAMESAPKLARRALDDAIPPPVLAGRSEDARLAITEIVANAVDMVD